MTEIASGRPLAPAALDRILRQHPRRGKGFWSRREILDAWRASPERWRERLGGHDLARFLRKKPVRSLSGVAVVTVFTAPHPCPGRCIFCPADVRMPKSYLPEEPGCQRAAAHGFDPYLQTWHRVETLARNGHVVDKIELLVLGGTFSAYPEPYRRWFVARCLDALSDHGAGHGPSARAAVAPEGPETPRPEAVRGRYNEWVTRLRGAGLAGTASEADLGRALAANETARVRCVGLTVETRPDRVDEAEVLRLRRLGVTRVQLGYQSTRDRILRLNRRGHDVEASRRATTRLRRAGFKVQAHVMLNLAGATPESDLADYRRVFSDPGLVPDEVKLYPTSLLETAELVELHRAGRWRPYPEEVLLDLVAECLAATPPTCRLARVIRDIPSTSILAGSRTTNLRERAEALLREQGRPARDIRSREVRGRPPPSGALSLRVRSHTTRSSQELFFEVSGPGEELAGFARLSLPTRPGFVPEIEDHALLRELHVYGEVARLGGSGAVQHGGLGRRLVAACAAEAARRGFRALSVISAVGTRPYYRALGFRDGPLYQTLPLG